LGSPHRPSCFFGRHNKFGNTFAFLAFLANFTTLASPVIIAIKRIITRREQWNNCQHRSWLI
jgi:hypothetical protein